MSPEPAPGIPAAAGKPGKQDFRRAYLARFRRFLPTLVLITIGSLAQSALVLPAAFLVKRAFDAIIAGRQLQELPLLGLQILSLIVSSAAVSLAVRHAALWITKQVIRDFRMDLLARSYEICALRGSASDRSRIHTAIVQDTERVDVMSNALLVMLPALILSASLAVILLLIAPRLALAMAVFVVPLAVSSRVLGGKLRASTQAFRGAFENFSRGVSFVLEVMDLTRLRGAQDAELGRQREHAEALRLSSGRMAWLAACYGTVQNSFGALAMLAVLLVGGMAIAAGSMSYGGLAAFYFIFSQLSASLTALWIAVPQVMLGGQSLANLAGLGALPSAGSYGGSRKHPLGGSIALERVWFGYGDKTIVADLSLALAAGTITAVTGRNGAGKTTLAHLLLGFLRPQSGRVLVDGLPLEELDLDDFRRQLGYLDQEPLIFSGTVKENIAYGFPQASAQDLGQAVDEAAAAEVVRKLGEGLDTRIGDRGVALSGGERQRIAIARTLLNRPRILILDEPTNHMDAAAVRELLRRLKALPYQPAILLITHDPAVAALAERIFELRSGSLVALAPNSAVREAERGMEPARKAMH